MPTTSALIWFVIWFVIWFASDRIGDREPLTLDPVNLSGPGRCCWRSPDLAGRHAAERSRR